MVTHYVVMLRKRIAGETEWTSDYVLWEAAVNECEHDVVDLIPYKFEYTFKYVQKWDRGFVLGLPCSRVVT